MAYLRGPEVQRRLMTATARRPAVPEVGLDPRFPRRVLVELPFPASIEVVDDFLLAYLNRIRRPAHTIYVLDVSGSMDGERIADLKQTLVNLTGADTSLTGRFARFRARERITMITFAGQVIDERDFTVEGAGPNAPGRAAIRDMWPDSCGTTARPSSRPCVAPTGGRPPTPGPTRVRSPRSC